MKIEKPEIITEAYYIVRDPLSVCVVVDVDHCFLDFALKKTSAIPCGEGVSHLHICSHPPPHEKKFNYSKVFTHHKKRWRPLEQQPKKTCEEDTFRFC